MVYEYSDVFYSEGWKALYAGVWCSGSSNSFCGTLGVRICFYDLRIPTNSPLD